MPVYMYTFRALPKTVMMSINNDQDVPDVDNYQYNYY